MPFPTGLAAKNMTVLIRVNIPLQSALHSQQIKALVRYQEPVDVKKQLYDYQGEIRSKCLLGLTLFLSVCVDTVQEIPLI